MLSSKLLRTRFVTRNVSTSVANSHLLVINAGSSSLKYSLFNLHSNGVGAAVFTGLVELSTSSNKNGRITHKTLATGKKDLIELPLNSHRNAFETAVNEYFGSYLDGIKAVGHRVVHGGETFNCASLVDNQVIEAIKSNIKLAPLHNPNNLLGIQMATELFGSCPQVVVFDTAFHATMPPKAFTYGIPYKLYNDLGIRRYGFHGTSHQYVAKKAASYLNESLDECNFITCHLGNGSSLAAIENGYCIDTSMGMTPLEGLIMGTRCGDIDPALHAFLCKELNMTIEEVDSMLNKKSGLLGICGDSDIRIIQDRVRMKNDIYASLALDVFAHRVRKYLGAYILEMNGKLDALIFTAGIGENSAIIRERVCQNLSFFGIELNDEKNVMSIMGSGPVEIQSENARTKVLVINTDEERSIAEQTYEVALTKKS
ncbi:acetate kinase [Plasmopara halstedii]|uniref:Probable acetate kinase n=1 Tax=Plasmopara halstedii TaxID=4781 RepID=A0A0P1AMX3_PLAHL|nr:acetate kinase [Plasmopara halstedii]CEG42569.1 acetate kinase [Plasmopara halstedii]|eukprot:XP_024578938.1 acetate kinase [Plasmopara halstedii]